MGKMKSNFDSLERARLERAERWREICDDIPAIPFKRSWKVAIIPPFAGAVARFIVHWGDQSVSVYADFYEALGYFGAPHWEIYPGPSGDNERFAIADVDEMVSAIDRGLKRQRRAPRLQPTPDYKR